VDFWQSGLSLNFLRDLSRGRAATIPGKQPIGSEVAVIVAILSMTELVPAGSMAVNKDGRQRS
jgi:hypothetical protein